MKKTLLSTSLSSILSVFLVCPIGAQQQAPPISQLKEQIQKLLLIDRDTNTPAHVKEFNRGMLEQRRNQLRTLLQTQISDLRKYQSSARSALGVDGAQRLETLIRELEHDLHNLDAGTPQAASTAVVPPETMMAHARKSRRTPSTPKTIKAAATLSPSNEANASLVGQEAPLTTTPTPDSSPAPSPSPITITSPDKDKTVSVREYEVEIEVGDPNIDDIMVAVYNPPTATRPVARMLTIKRSDQGKKSVVIELKRGANKIEISDLKDSSKKDTRTLTYTPVEAATGVLGATAATAPGGTGETPFTTVPEAGENVSVPVKRVAGETYQFQRNGQSVGNAVIAGADGFATTVFPEIAPGDRIGVVKLNNTGQVEPETYEEIKAESKFNESSPGAYGLLVGGAVISQQAEDFQQADPFFGFIAGYTSKVRGGRRLDAEHLCDRDGQITDSQGFFMTAGDRTNCYENGKKVNQSGKNLSYSYVLTDGQKTRTLRSVVPNTWRWNLRFQGIFQSSGRMAEATETTATTGTGGGGTTATNGMRDPFRFIASRKTFDSDIHAWIDFKPLNLFSIGPYAAVGFSTALDKNELQGEPVTMPNNAAMGMGTGATANTPVIVNSRSDNDIKGFYEGGALMNIKLLNKSLFVQSILAYGNYEALKDLDRDNNTRHRFIGKLRVFPTGLQQAFGRNIKGVPMFGVDLNSGTGPDHVRFFTGFAISINRRQFSVQ